MIVNVDIVLAAFRLKPCSHLCYQPSRLPAIRLPPSIKLSTASSDDTVEGLEGHTRVRERVHGAPCEEEVESKRASSDADGVPATVQLHLQSLQGPCEVLLDAQG